jgi:glycosyltransferase involved in cell wall biosynthesis
MKDIGGLHAVEVCTGYDETSHFKDPGLIASELQRLGFDVVCLVAQKGLVGIPYAKWPVELIPGVPGATTSWDDYSADVFLIYFINTPQLEWVRDIRQKNPGARIILKCDSDGLVPAGKVTVRSRAAKRQHVLAWSREIVSSRVMFQRPLSQARQRVAAYLFWLSADRIPELQRYLESFDRIVIESTEAARNLLLNFPSVAQKTFVVPNGVSQRSSALHRDIRHSIVAVGRFTDHRQKRPLVVWRVLRRFLASHPDWSVDIVGPYDAELRRTVHKSPSSIRERVQLRGPRPNDETRAIMASSSIYFSASAFEGFSVAMAEAVWEGCSVVSTPIPCAWDLVADGTSGTVAATFAEHDLLAALVADAEKWCRGEYDRATIAAYWRPRLDWSGLVRLILGLSLIHI